MPEAEAFHPAVADPVTVFVNKPILPTLVRPRATTGAIVDSISILIDEFLACPLLVAFSVRGCILLCLRHE